ncbi:prepilin-type N-terminal cleavage/methylation domain-containing protein [bacterium]|nr:prepilin-type N-terminal cleavage/methylation domain-containing protein [bacterium]
MDSCTIGIKRNSLQQGFTLLGVLVATAILLIVLLMAYRLYSDVSETAMKTSSSVISLDRTRVVEDQMRYYLYHAGLGVPADAPVIIEAKENSLALMLNSGYYSYVADHDLFLGTMQSTEIDVQNTAGLKSSFYDREEIPLTILSDDKVPLIAKDETLPVIPKNGAADDAKITVVTNDTAYWLRKGQYIGEVAQLHQFTLNNGELHLKTTHSDGSEFDRIIGSGIEGFDVAFYYKPTYFDEDDAPVWCADNSDEDPNCRYRPGNFEEPGSVCTQSDPDWDKCLPCAGHITVQIDTDANGIIDENDDSDGDGTVDATPLQEVAEFKDTRLLRFWILVAGDQIPVSKESQNYVVGRKILKFNDNRKRTLSVVDVDIKNL